jgi:hypothetical protein
MEGFMVIHALAQRGFYNCDIAKQVGVHPRTVRRALAHGGAPAPRPSRLGSRVDPYRPKRALEYDTYLIEQQKLPLRMAW